MLVHRAIKDQLLDAVLKSGKITLLYGPRQAGKSRPKAGQIAMENTIKP